MAVELTSTLSGEVGKIEEGKAYLVDFSKLNSVNDLMVVLSGLGITYPYNHPLIEHLKPFLQLDNPIPMQPAPQPKKAPFVPLDKLDTIEERIFNKGE
jgi:hypothetical protein